MKNVTITLEEDVAQWARIFAARHNTSVSQLLGQILKEKMAQEDEYEAAMNRYLSRQTTIRSKGRYPKREELYDRDRVR
jgi:plasmid stability protein